MYVMLRDEAMPISAAVSNFSHVFLGDSRFKTLDTHVKLWTAEVSRA